MTDIAKLVVSLEAQTASFTSGMDAATKKMASFEKLITSSIDGIKDSFKQLLEIGGAVELVKQLEDLSDEYTNLSNKLQQVTTSSENLQAIQEALFDISQKTRTGLADTSELYFKFAENAKQLGLSQQDLLGVTSSLNQVFQLSGASAEESSGAVLQFVRALANGEVTGRQFLTLFTRVPALANSLAVGFGTSVTGLKQLAEAGKITASDLINALQGQAPKIEEEFEHLTPTIKGAMTQLKNSVLQTFGSFSADSGLGAGVAATIKVLADNVGNLTKVLLVAAAAAAVFKASLIIGDISAAAAKFVQLFTAVDSGRAVLLGSAEAEKQRAAAVVESAQAEVDRTSAVLQAVKAEQSNALVTGEVTKVIDDEAISNAAAAKADYDRAAAALATVKAEQAKALVITDTTKVVSAQAEANVKAAQSEVELAQATLDAAKARQAESAGTIFGAAQTTQAQKILQLEQQVAVASQNLATEEKALAASTTTTNEAFFVREAAAKQVQALEAQVVVAQDALTAAEQRLAKATITTNDGMFARIAAAKQVEALEAQQAEAESTLAAAQARSAVSTKASAGALGLLGKALSGSIAPLIGLSIFASSDSIALKVVGIATAFSGLLLPLQAIGALLLANPITAVVTAIAAATVGLALFSDKIKLSTDGVITLRDTAVAAWQLMLEKLGPLASKISDTFTGFFQEGLIHESAVSIIAAAASVKDSVVGLFKGVGAQISNAFNSATSSIQARARQIASTRVATQNAAAPSSARPVPEPVDDAASLKAVNDIIKALQNKINTEKLGAVQTMNYRITQGDLQKDFAKLQVSGDSLRKTLLDLAAAEELQGLDKTIIEMQQQVSTFDKGSRATMEYRIAQGDLKKVFTDLGGAADSQKAKMLALSSALDTDKFEQLNRDLKEQVATLDKSGAAVLDYRIHVGDLKSAYDGATQKGKNFADNVISLQKFLDERKLQDDLAGINAELLTLQNNSAKAVGIKFDIDNRALVKQLSDAGNAAGLALVASQKAQAIIQAQLNDQQAKGGLIQDDLARKEQAITDLVNTGQLSELQGMQQTQAARTVAIDQLQQINAQMELLAQNSENPAVANAAKQWIAQFNTLKSTAQVASNAITTQLQGDFVTLFQSIADGSKSASDALHGFIASIEKDLIDLIAKDYAQQLFKGLLGLGGSGGSGGFLQTAIGAIVGGRASGGDVQAGAWYKVNEASNDSEWFRPGVSGSIVPQGKGGGGGITVTQTFVLPPGGGVSKQTQMQVAASSAQGIALANRRNN